MCLVSISNCILFISNVFNPLITFMQPSEIQCSVRSKLVVHRFIFFIYRYLATLVFYLIVYRTKCPEIIGTERAYGLCSGRILCFPAIIYHSIIQAGLKIFFVPEQLFSIMRYLNKLQRQKICLSFKDPNFLKTL